MALSRRCKILSAWIGNFQWKGMKLLYPSTISFWLIYSYRLVANPFKLTLRELMSDYENVTYPITLVCAGNRRKEQNVVRKSKGFSWGPAGLSTALFTGVVMKDIIERAKPLRRAKYVCMEGADKLVSRWTLHTSEFS
jgi:nitrate reductase (NAD(P)H)